MERRKLFFHQTVNQNHINRRGGCKKGNLVGRQIVKGRDIAKIHSSELDGAYAHHHQGMTERNPPDEGEENGKRAGHARHRDKAGREAGQAVSQKSE